MKSIWNKTSLHPLTYFFALSACLTGLFRELIIVSIIITFHEIGHLIVIRKFNYKVTKLELYPFGGLIKCEKDINTPLKEEIITALAGVFMQVVLGIIIALLYKLYLIRHTFYTTFILYNIVLLIFNLLPITPLDGYILLKSLLEYIFSYKMAFFISFLTSIIGLILFIWLNISFNFHNYIIIGFFLYKIGESLKKFKYLQIRFYLERLIKSFSFKRFKIIKGLNINKMAKDRSHYFLYDNYFITEKEVLAKKFDIKSNLW